MDIANAKEVFKRVKILTGTPEEIDRAAAEFEKNHSIIEIKQKSPTTMFIFYLEGEKDVK